MSWLGSACAQMHALPGSATAPSIQGTISCAAGGHSTAVPLVWQEADVWPRALQQQQRLLLLAAADTKYTI